MTRPTLRTLALALLLAGASACKTPEEAAPTDTGAIPRDASDAADAPPDAPPDVTADAQPDVTTDVTADAQPDVTTDVTADATDAGGDVAPDATPDVADGSCAPGDGGCFSCPSTSAQIINRCTGASCARFDNSMRLTRLLPDGGLPPLP
jgi:hypothetical protein